MDLLYMVIFLITIIVTDIDGAILKQINQINIDVKEVLYSSQKEESIIQCAHKCRLIDKGAAVVFQESKCECLRYKRNGKNKKEEGLTKVFINQIITKKVHGCDKPSKGYCSDFCNKNGDAVLCTCQKGYGLSTDGKTCKKIHVCDKPSKGGCSDICNKNGDAVSCSCQKGYGLSTDGKTCKKIYNIALRKIAYQSSKYYDYTPASNAVDGDMVTRAYTDIETNPWLEIDFGEVKRIVEILLKGYVGSSYNQGLVAQTLPGNSWVRCTYIGHLVGQGVIKFKCDNQPTYSPHFRIWSTELCYLEIFEVQIFGF